MPNVDIDAMLTRAGADTHVVVQCPHAVCTVSNATSLQVGVRTAADLTNLGLPMQCDNVKEAIKAEFNFFVFVQRRRDMSKPESERREMTGEKFVRNLGYTIARGILRSVFSERNPQLFYEFLQMGPYDEPQKVEDLIKPFTSVENDVYNSDMITEDQVRAILKDYRRELGTKMTVGQQYALLHVQQKMQRDRDEANRKAKADAERKKLVDERGIAPPGPHTAAFVATPSAATKPAVITVAPLRDETPLVTFGGTSAVVVPLGVPENTASAPNTVAAMSTTVSAASAAATAAVPAVVSAATPADVVLTGGVMSRAKKTTKKKTTKKTKKKTASRPRARKKTAKTKVKPVEPVAPMELSEPEAPAAPARPGLMMLDNNAIDSAAALAVAKTAPPRPGLMMLEGDDGDDIPPPPKLVRQTNGVAFETIDAPAEDGAEAGTRQEEKKVKKRRSRATRKKKDGEKKSVKKRKTSKKA